VIDNLLHIRIMCLSCLAHFPAVIIVPVKNISIFRHLWYRKKRPFQSFYNRKGPWFPQGYCKGWHMVSN